MSALVIIPARMAATRLPGKPLALIGGVPMVVRAWRAAAASGLPAVVACAEAEIAQTVRAAGGEAVLTDPALASGSDRILAALRDVDPQGRATSVINLQGDMPFADPSIVRACAELLDDERACDISTLVAREAELADRANPDVVKAVVAIRPGERRGRALYFTRSVLFGDEPVWRHIGVYGYRREALERFAAAPPSPLERRERLEQLRALELGMSIWVQAIDRAPLSVDTPDDLARARALAQQLETSA